MKRCGAVLESGPRYGEKCGNPAVFKGVDAYRWDGPLLKPRKIYRCGIHARGRSDRWERLL